MDGFSSDFRPAVPSAAAAALPFRGQSPYQSQSHRFPERNLHALSTPMSIPSNSRGASSPPPPLPPPRHIDGLNDGQDHGWHFGNRDSSRGGSPASSSSGIAAGSSLLGGGHFRPTSRPTERKVDFGSSSRSLEARREPSSHGFDGKQMPDVASLLEYSELQGERQLGQQNRELTSHAYDKALLQRIGGPGTPPRSSGHRSPSHSGFEELAPGNRLSFQRLNGQLRPLSLPERRHSSNDVERPRFSSSQPSHLSPRLSGLRSPMSDDGLDRTQGGRVAPASSSLVDENATKDSADNSPVSKGSNTGGSPGMTVLHIHDKPREDQADYQTGLKAGQKRRALSPPSEALVDPRMNSNNSSADWSSRMGIFVARQPSQFSRAQPPPASFSSAASSVARSNPSYPSSYAPSQSGTAATSYSSEALPSPSFSEHAVSAYSPSSQLQSHHSRPQSQEGAMPPPPAPTGNRAPPVPHRRTTNSGSQRAPGLWICDCCPKKPKKFESEDELRVHEMEKQHACLYCHNRFKNKNEAERHQNSLHLRRHSWSCAALTTFEMAFHPTPHSNIPIPQPGSHHPAYPPAPTTDTCGYCGMEFANPPNWDERVGHLNDVHKFGECNQSKKFFRADHFRQHLKHSHAGTSGKWTNMLENACMKDEPLPQPIDRHSSNGYDDMRQRQVH